MTNEEALAQIKAAIEEARKNLGRANRADVSPWPWRILQDGPCVISALDEAVKALEKVLETDDEYGVNPGARTRLEAALVRIASKLEGK